MRRALLSIVWLVACGGVSSDEEAERAYIGLDAMVEKGLNLGMAGYGAADSANIPDQVGAGDLSGTITVGGQVDQGASDNKEMRLVVALDDYADEIDLDDDGETDEFDVVFETVEAEPLELDLSLRGIPDGTLEGALTGTVQMDGDLDGPVILELEMTGEIEADPEVTDGLRRVDGSTHIFGLVTSAYGEYEVDVTR